MSNKMFLSQIITTLMLWLSDRINYSWKYNTGSYFSTRFNNSAVCLIILVWWIRFPVFYNIRWELSYVVRWWRVVSAINYTFTVHGVIHQNPIIFPCYTDYHISQLIIWSVTNTDYMMIIAAIAMSWNFKTIFLSYIPLKLQKYLSFLEILKNCQV